MSKEGFGGMFVSFKGIVARLYVDEIEPREKGILKK